MKKKMLILLTCLLSACLLGVFTACNPASSESESGSTPPKANEYTIVFVDFDESVISSKTYEEGETVVAPSNPTRAADNTYTYEFAGWDSQVQATASSNATYKATYTGTYIDYTVTFLAEDGEEVLQTGTFHYGDTVTAPSLPENSADETYTYVYSWNADVVAVAGNATYTVVCSKEYVNYVVKFLNADGSEYEVQNYHYGDEIVAPTTNPSKDADNTYNYVFAGWGDVAQTVTAQGLVYTATFTPEYVNYSVVFIDDDGTEILRKDDYHYGDTVEEPSSPTKESALFDIIFDGWDSVVVDVTEDATYTAVYCVVAKSGHTIYNAVPNGDGLTLNAGSIGNGANFIGPNDNDLINQSYFAFDGNYGIGDYIAFDFTGKNMPEIAFFAQNYNKSMYYQDGSKQGIVLKSGITNWNGAVKEDLLDGSTTVSMSGLYMINNDSWINKTNAKNSKLARANLADDTHYTIIVGVKGGSSHGAGGITIEWYLYDIDNQVEVESGFVDSWNFFTGSNSQVGNKTLNDLVGSIVLYGKFGTACTLDKVHGIYENSNLSDLVAGLINGEKSTVTFKSVGGETLKEVEVEFGSVPVYNESLPTPSPAEDTFFNYSYAWDKAFGKVYGDTTYTLKLVQTAKAGYSFNQATINGETIVLAKGKVENGANYTRGEQNDPNGNVDQAYFAIDGNYGLDSYIVFDFTGKNMPEIAFFAQNYNDSMYANGTSKQGIVVVTGITTWNGTLESGVNANGTQINFGHPFMIQDASSGSFCQGAFANSQLGRANLVDGTHYRVIMGFTAYGASAVELKWCLYNLDTNEIVEENSMHSWNFFTGSDAAVGNMTLSDLTGSIVLYGKFGATCTIDKYHGVESGTYADVVAEYTTQA